jgi:protein-L-isoaspartate O-methyltransferase
VTSRTATSRTILVNGMRDRGTLTDPGWLRAFSDVPRELFVPYFFVPNRGAPGWRIVEKDIGKNTEWLDGIYADDALVTQLGGNDAAVEAARRGERVTGTPTSSSSAPSLMAEMLHALELGDNSSEQTNVLELGIGAGYNAALLCHRLGPDRVTSVEVDPLIAARARTALASAGYHPAVVTGDGTRGHPSGAPYHRVIATVALPRVPPALLAQAIPGALLLLPLVFAGSGGLMALLRCTGPDRASGPILPHYGGFMASRDHAEVSAPVVGPLSLAKARPVRLPVEALAGDTHPSSFYLSLRCRTRYRTLGFTPSDDSTGPQLWGCGADGSTFTVVSAPEELRAKPRVVSCGPLWNALESAYQDWLDLGRPARDRFGVEVAGCQSWVWRDTPDQVVREVEEA